MSESDSEAVQCPPKTVNELSRGTRGWSPMGARCHVGFLVFFYSLILYSFTLSARDGKALKSLLPYFLALLMPTAELVRDLRDKKHPLGEALKRGYSNPDYPPEEAARVHVVVASLVGLMLILFGGISYFTSARTQDDAMTAVYLISGGLAVFPLTFLYYKRECRRMDAEWGNSVALRDASSEKVPA